jgi:fibroblast growth factor receptor 1
MTLGASPYPSIQSMERLFEMLSKGYRMEKPSGCSEEVYSIMKICWNSNPMLRPCFTNLVDNFEKLLSFARDIDYLVRNVLLKTLKKKSYHLFKKVN